MTGIEDSPKGETNSNFTWARAFRDIGVNAINTGQFPFFCIFIVVILVLLKMPGGDVSKLIFNVFANFREFAVSGYVLFAIALIICSVYIKILRNAHKKQVEQRDNLIKNLTKKVTDSSSSITVVGDA